MRARIFGPVLAVTCLTVVVASAVAASQLFKDSFALGAHRAVTPVTSPSGRPFELGVFEPNGDTSYQQIAAFGKAVGESPKLDLFYQAWNSPFQFRFANTAVSHNAVPVMQLESGSTPLGAIINGRYDAYLTSLARSIAQWHDPLIASFDAEANGSWEKWGHTHYLPSVWVRADRHVISIFRGAGATNVIWMWTMSVQPTAAVTAQYWPGRAYVDWVGLDGYYVYSYETFKTRFVPIITEVRKLTRKPILIGETSINARVLSQAKLLPDLFAGVRKYRLIGLVWFDEDQPALGHEYRLEDHPKAVQVFKTQLQETNSYFGTKAGA